MYFCAFVLFVHSFVNKITVKDHAQHLLGDWNVAFQYQQLQPTVMFNIQCYVRTPIYEFHFYFQYVCHSKENVKYSYKKMWYLACFVRGMTVDEALKQLQFVNKKGALFVRDTILEAQKLAVNEHNVEFKSNLWISESFVGKGIVVKGT